MKKLSLLIILILIIPFAYADWFYNSQHITTGIGISSTAKIVQLKPSGYIDSATINLTFFPKETDNQKILNSEANPDADITDSTMKFNWKKPSGQIDFRYAAEVRTTNTMAQIRHKIDFPIQNLPKDIEIYTKPSKTIDSGTPDIVRLGSELAKGEDDLYSAVFKIADWTKNNIEYNLSTLTADVSQKASWVLQNRQGVCDELTSLFIALLRSVGVPARFVSGVAYTNSDLFPEKWGAHGWAEVYFPGYGWVPFDVTYGEYGWVDPTHIKFKDSADSDEPSTYYQWLGKDADLKTNELSIKTNLVERDGYANAPIKIQASVLKKAVSFGSYNLVTATIENTDYYYYATELYLSKPREVEIIGSDSKSVLLLPKEKKAVFWILKMDDNLDKKYSYTLPIVVVSTTNITSSAGFESNYKNQEVSYDEVMEAAKLLEEEKAKAYSGNVLVDCKASKNEFYEYEDAKVSCIFKNTGNIYLEKLNACFEGRCNQTDLGISQTREFAFDINASKIGTREVPVTLSNELVSKAAYVNIKINDMPKIEIEDIAYPANVSYEENFTVSFFLAKKSQSDPKNVMLAFSQNGVSKNWYIDDLSESRRFVLKIEGSQLKYGRNNYKISAVYNDDLKKIYETKKEFSIQLTNANLLQRAYLALNWIQGVSYETIALMLLTGTIAFLAVVLILFRRGKKKVK